MVFSESFLETMTGELLMTFLVAMVPVIELRGAIPAGIAAGLPPALAGVAAVAGNLVPAPLIILLALIHIGRCRRTYPLVFFSERELW